MKFLVCACVLVAACSGPPVMTVLPPDGGPAPVLTILTPPGAQIGLHYNATVTLRVSYLRGDAAHTPLVGQQVQFRFFGNPAGSTLSAAQALTDADGVAQVTLTADATEAEFRVVASATNAADVNFSVAVSELDFVQLDVSLAASPSPSPTTLDVRIYDSATCATVGVQAAPPDALQSLTAPGPSATVKLINLLARSYAVEGRVTDATGELIADGCIDLPAGLLSPGDVLGVTLPLGPVQPSPVGVYQLHSVLASPSPNATAPSAAWHALSDCPNGLASALLDGMMPQLSPLAVTSLDAERGAVDADGCHTSTSTGGLPSLDGSLEALLTPPLAPLQLLPAVVSDLDALTGNAAFDSIFTVAGTVGAYYGEHALTRLVLGPTGGTQVATDLTLSGLPVIDVRDIPLGYNDTNGTGGAGALQIGAHAFTLHLGHWWRSGFFAVAVLPRFPALPATTQTSAPLLSLFVSAAARDSLTGCAAVESLVCTGLPPMAGCVGTAAPACAATIDALGARLDAAFGPPFPFAAPSPSASASPSPTPPPSSPSAGDGPLDFTLTGIASGADTLHNLTVQQISNGSWATSYGAASFQGSRVP